MIYFSADRHFNHKNILKYCNRPWSTIEEMNEGIIERHNSKVNPGDTVYDLGDFAFSNHKQFLSRLNGNIIRIKGSHDRDMKSPRMLVIRPEELLDEYGNQRSITLCHYSMRTWETSHYGSFHLFGHSHGNLEPYGLSFDVGVDCWNYYPASLDEICEKMATLNPIVDFRKNKG